MNSKDRHKVFNKIFSLLIVLLIAGCSDDAEIDFLLDSFKASEFYTDEIIPEEYHGIYGKWALNEITGGFSGSGYDTDFDYLEIKNFGIYGLVRGGTLFEYGRIELDTFDSEASEYLQIRLIPEYTADQNPYMNPPLKYVELKSSKSLDLISPCCDFYNHHFRRID